jgi:hypothetical protein
MMIFPEDYKVVGMTFGDPETRSLDMEPVYFSTKYIVACLGDKKYKIFKVENEPSELLLTRARSIELIAQENEIVLHEIKLDAHDRTRLIQLASEKIRGTVNTVIFEGKDKHITFVHKPDLCDITDIQIIDVIPPDPPWLSFAIERLVKSGILGELNIKFEHIFINIKQFEGDNTVFPCYCSGLKGKYLDTDSDIKDNSLLIGCDISRAIFDLRFPDYIYRHINMCPLETEFIKPTKPFITRCCQSIRSGLININGHDGVVVHWGASEFDILDGIRLLVKRINGELDEDRSDRR